MNLRIWLTQLRLSELLGVCGFLLLCCSVGLSPALGDDSNPYSPPESMGTRQPLSQSEVHKDIPNPACSSAKELVGTIDSAKWIGSVLEKFPLGASQNGASTRVYKIKQDKDSSLDQRIIVLTLPERLTQDQQNLALSLMEGPKDSYMSAIVTNKEGIEPANKAQVIFGCIATAGCVLALGAIDNFAKTAAISRDSLAIAFAGVPVFFSKLMFPVYEQLALRRNSLRWWNIGTDIVVQGLGKLLWAHSERKYQQELDDMPLFEEVRTAVWNSHHSNWTVVVVQRQFQGVLTPEHHLAKLKKVFKTKEIVEEAW